MPNTTTGFARWRGADSGRKRQRPKTVEVVKCDACGSIYDTMPRDQATGLEQCPTCKADHSWLRRARIKD